MDGQREQCSSHGDHTSLAETWALRTFTLTTHDPENFTRSNSTSQSLVDTSSTRSPESSAETNSKNESDPSSGGNYIHTVEIWKHVATVKSGSDNMVRNFLDFCPRQELEIEGLSCTYTIVRTYTTPHILIEIITDGKPPLFMFRPGRPVLLSFNNSWITAEELVRLAKHGHQMARVIHESS